MSRLGLIVPSTNTVSEMDFQEFSPPDVSVHTARMYIEATTAESERRMVTEYLPQAAKDLGTMRPDVVVFSCTSAGAVMGEDGEAKLIEDVGRLTGAPVVSTNAAVHAGLRKIGASRVAVLTPYIQELTDRICSGIERSGLTVALAAGMGVVDPFELAEITPAEIGQFAEEQLAAQDFDTLFVSCTNVPAFRARDDLLQQVGTPVVTSNQAALDEALRVLAEPVAVGVTRPGQDELQE